MYRSECVTQSAIHQDNGESWNLVYHLHFGTTEDGLEIYGLRIDKVGANGLVTESETTPAFTASKDEALAMARAFAAGTVPPCVLLEMADEWLNSALPT